LIPCEDFAIAVAQALHLWTPGGVSGIVRVSKNTATPNLTYLPKVTYDVDIESELTNPDMGFTLPAVITVGGGRVADSGHNLVIASSLLTVTMTQTGATDYDLLYQSGKLRAGEVAFVNSLTFTTGVPNPIFTFAIP
jgi:hypothetical protein